MSIRLLYGLFSKLLTTVRCALPKYASTSRTDACQDGFDAALAIQAGAAACQ